MKNLLTVLVIIALGWGVFYLYNNNKAKNNMPEENPVVMEEKVIEEPVRDNLAYIDISPMDAMTLLEENPEIIVIDVSPKYAEGHLPGAVNYYVGDGSLDEAIPMLDPMATYLVYCHVDSAAIAGAEKLITAGFENVYRLEGNYSGWVEAGYDVEM